MFQLGWQLLIIATYQLLYNYGIFPRRKVCMLLVVRSVCLWSDTAGLWPCSAVSVVQYGGIFKKEILKNPPDDSEIEIEAKFWEEYTLLYITLYTVIVRGTREETNPASSPTEGCHGQTTCRFLLQIDLAIAGSRLWTSLIYSGLFKQSWLFETNIDYKNWREDIKLITSLTG